MWSVAGLKQRLNLTHIVEWRKLDHSVVATVSGAVTSPSLCLCHRGHSEHIFVIDLWFSVLI